jgi:hypothetical protein
MMNIDSGRIQFWENLSAEEKKSGRWVKLGKGEHARAEAIPESERAARLDEIFNPKNQRGPNRGFIPGQG